MASRTKSSRTKKRAAKPAKPTAETPIIPPQPPSAWRDGEMNPDASMTTLAASLLEDFESDTPFVHGDRATELLVRTLRSVADDCELASAVGDGLDHTQCISRVMRRIESRARVSIEIARRLASGEVTS